MTTRVVHVRSRAWIETPTEQRRYVGRAFAEFAASEFRNPYRMRDKSDAERRRVLALFRPYAQRMWSASHIRRLLKDRVIGCWCADQDGPGLTGADQPHVCHGQYLAAVCDGIAILEND